MRLPSEEQILNEVMQTLNSEYTPRNKKTQLDIDDIDLLERDISPVSCNTDTFMKLKCQRLGEAILFLMDKANKNKKQHCACSGWKEIYLGDKYEVFVDVNEIVKE